MLSERERHGPFLLDDGRLMGTEYAAAAFTDRHRRQVAKYCTPIGRHPVTKAVIYDLDDCHAKLSQVPRRVRR